MACAARQRLRVVQWNVFEDGLTDTPGNLGFSPDFQSRFSTLLSSLSDDGSGRRFEGFASARDFTAIPGTLPLATTESFFGHLDVIYNAVYHHMGGQTRFGSSAPGDPPNFGNSVRTLFLRSAVDGDVRTWATPSFEEELQKAAASVPDAAARLRRLKEAAFSPSDGTLTWRAEEVGGMYKRRSNVLRDKWRGDLAAFMSAARAPAPTQPLRSFLSVGAELPPYDPRRPLVEIAAQADQIQALRTPTLQSGVWRLLLALCVHSMHSPAAERAVRDFAGPTAATDSPEARAAALLPAVLREVDSWFDVASLRVRHQRFVDTVVSVSPDVLAAVEYDDEWKKLPLPASRKYSRILGEVGHAAVLYDADVLEHVRELSGAALPTRMTSRYVPKSHCIALLRSLGSGALFLVVAVHLESSPPSDSRKVMVRREQVLSTLRCVSEIAGSVAAGGGLTVALCGDFNAVREEFVHGNTPAFFEEAAVAAIVPPVAKPVGECTPPAEGLARIEDAELRLQCDGVELREVSRPRGATSCSRAGSSMTIDYIFAARLGTGMPLDSTALALATEGEIAQAGDATDGVRQAVVRWGSDHLPVGCDLTLPA
eukprot:TRINITY_DN17591_c0_g1_i1.p1 TRINITY_DN17591_c0_g1~~TRINITY_DN17591_c0_g1_i1.p1  ORF type:complete len:623 (+),score=218.18 TRINITY_DN17591_c0_g1_i1:77-1870(+)